MTDAERPTDKAAANMGHNSAGFAGDALRAYVQRVEHVREEINGLQADVSQIYAEAKASGLDVKTMKKLIAERTRDQVKLEEETALLEVYRAAMDGG